MNRRKLLMNNKKKEQQIITDGLVLHLDGDNKGNNINNGYWTDLIGGVQFKLEDCIINSNNIEFNGVTSYAWNGPLVVPQDKDATIEVVFDDYDYNTKNKIRVLFMPRTAGAICFGIIGIHNVDSFETCITNSGSTVGKKREIFTLHNIVSANLNGMYNNKVELKIKQSNGLLLKDAWKNTIGKRSISGGGNETHFYGKIYAIRIYNRKLSEEEILYNQQCDIDKYFGGTI